MSMHVQSFSSKFRGQCRLLHHRSSTEITKLGMKVHVRLQLWCD